MIIAYSLILGVSIALLLGYLILVTNKERWMILLFSSVILANTGYLLEALAGTQSLALFANDLAYLGALLVMLSTLMSIEKLCGFRPNRKKLLFLAVAAALMFTIVATSPMLLPYYYTDVFLDRIEIVPGSSISVLKKTYGPLYPLYKVYIVSYLVGMVATIIYSIRRHRVRSYKVAALLFFVAFANVLVWLTQKSLQIRFNMLTVAYILGACVLLLLFWMMQDYVHKDSVTPSDPVVVEKVVVIESAQSRNAAFSPEKLDTVLDSLSDENKLTETEFRILTMLLGKYMRKEISDTLSISENTTKTHISHIYKKLGVTSKHALLSLFK